MSEKMTCPGCDAHTHAVAEAHYADLPCPYCGLSATTAHEILAVRQRRADEGLKAKAEEALLRAGKAEGELRIARYRLHRVRAEIDLGHGRGHRGTGMVAAVVSDDLGD
jgi:hypothetical protein